MRERFRALGCLAFLALICAVGNAREQTTLPSLDPSLGRIVIYRPWHYPASASGSMVALNGEFVGMCRAGKYFYVDTKPGIYYLHTYLMSLGSMTSASEQTLAVRAGQTSYVQLNVGFSYSLEMVPGDKAGGELSHVQFDSSAIAEKDAQSAKHVDRARLDFEQYKQTSGIDIGSAQQAASAPPSSAASSAQQPTTQPGSSHRSVFSTVSSGSGSSLAANMASPSTPPTPASGPVAGTVPSDARITLALTAHCAKDPDPMGFVSMSFYSGCKQKELNEIRSQIAGALAQRHVMLADGDAGDLRVTVTLTKEEDKRPSSFVPFGDFMPGTMDYESIYQIADSSGRVLNSGNITSESPDNHMDVAEKQYVAKVADTLTPQLMAAVSAAPSGAAPVPEAAAGLTAPPASLVTAAANSPVARASEANLYEIVAQAYRSLAVKPPLSDNARAENRKAEDLMAAGNFKGAAGVYGAILATDHWWPEGYRGLALALGQAGDPAGAIVWMRRYLAFVPSAGDAAEMQVKVDAWARLAPPPQPPANLTAPPGLHLGVACSDTPGILALALGQPDLDGALIALVLPGSVAESAGLQKGDIVVSYDGAPVRSAQELIANAAKAAPGATAKLVIQRGAAKSTIMLAFPGPTPPAAVL